MSSAKIAVTCVCGITMDRRIVEMRLICSLGHCECEGHTVHKFSQRRLTTD